MAQRVRRDPVLLDTGPLLTYLALRYADSIKASKSYRDRLFQDIRSQSPPFNEDRQERLSELIEVRAAQTTPHVILEATRLRKHSELAKATGFRDFSLRVLVSGAISEVWCSLEELCKEPEYLALTLRFGVADASLLFVSAREECLTLTDDRGLFGAYGIESRFKVGLLDEYLGSSRLAP
jgi:hypothetical protein